jgi:hypothetical protein
VVNDVFICGGRLKDCRQDYGQNAENGFHVSVALNEEKGGKAHECSGRPFVTPVFVIPKNI